MRRVTRRNVLVGAIGGCFLWPVVAEADFFGGDLPLLAGILAEAIAQVAQIAQVVANFVQEIELVRTELQSLDANTFGTLTSWLDSAALDYNTLIRDTSSMGYTVASVNAQYQTLYPRDASRMPFGQFGEQYAKWSDEILSAAQVAARSQAVVSNLQASTQNASNILSQSQSAQGVVAQLQAVVQMLGVIHADTSSLVQTLATTGRVLSDASATGGAERQLSLEKKRRNLAKYTDRGAPVRVPDHMP